MQKKRSYRPSRSG